MKSQDDATFIEGPPLGEHGIRLGVLKAKEGYFAIMIFGDSLPTIEDAMDRSILGAKAFNEVLDIRKEMRKAEDN